MSISKKFYSIVLAIVAVFALVGCTLPTAFSRTISEAQADLQAVADRVVFDNVDEVTSDLTFPTETQWVDKVTYEWQSSNEAVISNTGKVTRPETGAGNAVVVVKVVITAEYTKLDDGTFKLGTVSTEKEWTFTVLEMPEKLTIQKTLDKIVAGQIQKGDEVSFTGIVVAYNQKIYSNDDGTSDLVLRPYVYDGTGGFFIYAQFNELAVGDEVAVTGTLDAYNGYYQIKSSGINVEVLSKGNAIPEPTKASIAEVIAMNTVGGSLNGANGTIGGRLYNVDAKVVNNGTAEKPEYFLENPLGEGKFEVYYETAYTHVPGHENAKSYAEVLAPYEGKYVNITVCPYNVYDGYISVVFTSLPITEIEKPELTDEQQAAIILNGVSLDEEYREDFELPVVEGVEWEIVSGTGVELVDGVAKVTRTTEDQEVVLKATATYGEAKASKEFTVIIPGKPADPVVPGTVDEVTLTVESLDLPSQAYSAGTVTVSGVAFEYVQLGNYGDGIQMRDKNGNTSLLWNTSAFDRPIAYIELTYSSTKDTYDNPDAVIYSFGNANGEYTYTTKLSTTAGVKTYTITPDAETYTYFKLEHDYGYSMYWESINIVYVEQKQEAVETELNLTVETLDLPSQAYSAGTVTYAGVSFEYVQLGNYGDGIQMRDKNGNTSLLWNTSAFGSGIIRIELTYSSTKDTYDNPDAVIYSFGNANGEYTYTTKLSTTAGVKTYTITPDAETYTYFKLEHDYGYSMYWESIKVVYMTGGNLPEPPVHEHVFVEGKCECGEIDPDYVPSHVHEVCPECGKCLDKECPDGDVCQGHEVVADYITIAEAKKSALNTSVTVKGVVSTKTSSHILIQDGKDGIQLYYAKDAAEFASIKVGDEILATGTYTVFNGLHEVKSIKKLEVLSSGHEVKPIVITSVAKADIEQYQNMLVAVELTYVSGSIANKTNSTFKDANGVTVTVRPDSTWGTIPTLTLTEGDKVVVTGYVNWYNNPQISNVPDYDFIVVSGGELPHEHVFVNGKCECGEEDPNYVPPHVHEVCPECGKCLDKECPDGDVCQGHEEVVVDGRADFETIVTPNANGDSKYTNTYTTTAGWVVTNSAIQCGGSTNMNPQFTVIGPDNTYKAVCMNGKVGAAGSITSPTLTGGIQTLKLAYTKMFTDTALKATVTVTEVATGNVQTYVIDATLSKDEKYVVYPVEWVLETPITGDFTIVIVNNCPSANSSSNKDRLTVLSIEWIAPKQTPAEPVFADLESFTKGDGKDTSYVERTNAAGWVATNARCDEQTAFGDAQQLTLNGKNSAVGTLTSTVISGGVSKVSFNYGYAFSESGKVKLIINIKDTEGKVVATTTLEASGIVQEATNEFVWELETPVEGDFVLELVNGCPSNSSKNKDRLTIWNLAWLA